MVAATGSLTATFGANPMADGAPTGKHVPFLLNMSTSAVAGAKIAEARCKGETLPAGLVESANVQPLTDPADFEFGKSFILPMAGVRGYGLKMMVDILANVLGDFAQGVLSADLPRTAYDPSIKSVEMEQVLLGLLHRVLQEGFVEFGKTLRGYVTNDAVVHAPAITHRRCVRHRLCAFRVILKPWSMPRPAVFIPAAKEQAMLGGIVSAAIDGARCADKATALSSSLTSFM